MKKNTRYCDLPDIKIAYEQNGQGQTIILLHGNSGSKKTFRQYQSRFFSSYATYALDSRGHGQSISSDLAYSIEQYSQDVIHFCTEKGIKDAYVIGYSDGGNVALYLAKNASDTFKKVVLISPNYLASGIKEKSLGLFRRLLKLFCFFDKLGFNMKRPIMRFQLMLIDIGLTEIDLASIHADILLIYAENDMIREEHILKIAEIIPNAKRKKIKKCSHFSIVNAPDTISEIRTFFAC
jgi:pimeloyl-ACP methyl ester carboxylesterase